MRNKFISRVQYLCTLPFIFSIIVSSQNITFQNYLRQPNFSSSSVRFRLVSFGWITHIGHRVSLGSGLLTELWGDLSVWAALSGLCTSGIVSVYSTQRWQVSLPSVLPGCTLLTGNQGGYCKSLTNFTSSVMQFSPVGMSITFEGFGGHCSVLPLGFPVEVLSCLCQCGCFVLPWVGLELFQTCLVGMGHSFHFTTAPHLSSLYAEVWDAVNMDRSHSKNEVIMA